MKTKLLLLSLFISGVIFAQIPTNGLLGQYNFDNGNILADNTGNGNNLTQTGTALIETPDRFSANPLNSVHLNGDYLNRSNVSFGTNTYGTDQKLSISFWIKTSTNDTNFRTIIDDSDRTNANLDSPRTGYFIYLYNGRIGARLGYKYNHTAGGTYHNTTSFTSSININDGNWHHVVIRLNELYTPQNMTGLLRYYTTINIDGGSDEQDIEGHSNTSIIHTSVDSSGSLVVGNNRVGSLTTTERYEDIIDDILVYNRILSNAEITNIVSSSNYCFAPDSSIISTSSITKTSGTINIANSGDFDLAYHKTSEPFSSATIINNITSGSDGLTGLDEFTEYNVYIRENCSNNSTAWSSPITFKTTRDTGRIYVNHNATGNNNGISWVNAYTNLEDALSNVTDAEEIWIAQGTYIPHTSDRDVSFNIIKTYVKLYGGFNGTETLLEQRNFTVNETILSGDLQNNDDTGLEFINTTRNDNSYNVITIERKRATIDGFTITGGHANGTASEHKSGAAISKDPIRKDLYIFNCIFKNNVSLDAGAAIFIPNQWGDFVTVSNSKFYNNLARYGTTIYSSADNNNNNYTQTTIKITNCLFYSNTTKNNGSSLGLAGSAGWFKAYAPSSVYNCNLTNNTYYNNADLGTDPSLSNNTRSSIGMSYNSGTFNGNTANCIFWNNTTTGGTVAKSIAQIDATLGQNITVNNAIDEDGFSNIGSGNLTNTSNSNPLFVDASIGDYTLQSGSPAIDSGDNTKIPSGITTDLSGNSRIENSTVDMGCYEYISLAINVDIEVYLQGAALNPNLGEETLMRDDLRVGGYIPTTSPYTDALTCSASVFAVTSNDAIVDWILVELRDATTNTTILQSQSALLQRDGDVVSTDGTSPLSFAIAAGNYYIAIKHRNHLGIMSSNVISLSSSVATVNFTNSASPITYGTNAQSSFGIQSGMLGMWAGNVGSDTSVRYQGSGNDTNTIKDNVLGDSGNATSSNLHSFTGYDMADVNLDGSVRYQGSGNDANTVKDVMLAHPDNQSAPSNLFIIQEQLPQ